RRRPRQMPRRPRRRGRPAGPRQRGSFGLSARNRTSPLSRRVEPDDSEGRLMNEPDGEGLLRILRPLGKYEDGWLPGEPIALEALLREADEVDRSELLHQALGLELHHRRRRGESPVLDEYLTRWPDDTSIIRAAFEETTVTLPTDRDEGSCSTEPSAGS